MKKQTVFLLLLLSPLCHSFSQAGSWFNFIPSDTINQKRLRVIGGVSLGLYPVSMWWLYSKWYKDYPQSDFHFFNDGSEWLQVDKVGHIWTSYNIAKPLTRSFEWAGLSKKKSAWYGAGIATLYLTTVEIFDGYSQQWGFSWPDVICNTIGAGGMTAQELAWGEQRIALKLSFHQTEYSKYRPQLLGENLPENFLKDYNGWTYWLTVSPRKFMNQDKKFPKWLGLAFGYGGEGMTGGKTNPVEVDGNPVPYFVRERQYYLSLDIDLSQIRWKSKFLHSFFRLINIIKIPAPTIELNSGSKTKFYLFYF